MLCLVAYWFSFTESSLLSEKIIEQFRNDGVVVIRNVLSGKALQEAIDGARAVDSSISINPYYEKISFSCSLKNNALKSVALHSDVPKIVGELLSSGVEAIDIRLLKDAVLAFRPDQKVEIHMIKLCDKLI